jgi:hypothetical protein
MVLTHIFLDIPKAIAFSLIYNFSNIIFFNKEKLKNISKKKIFIILLILFFIFLINFFFR